MDILQRKRRQIIMIAMEEPVLFSVNIILKYKTYNLCLK